MTKYLTNNFSVVNLYKKPSRKSEIVTQMIFGESFSISKKTIKWLKIKIKEDGYNGYIKNLLINLIGKHDWHYNPLWRHGHIKFFSVKTLSKLLINCGYTILNKKFSGRFYPISCSMIFLIKKIR